MSISWAITGPLARANRIDPRHVPNVVDAWLINTVNPVIVTFNAQDTVLRSQFALSLAQVADLPGGSIREEATHVLALGAVTKPFELGQLDAGELPAVGGTLLSAQFQGDDDTARRVAFTVAQGFAEGEIPLQGRHIALSFVRATRMVALTLHVNPPFITTKHPPIEMTLRSSTS